MTDATHACKVADRIHETAARLLRGRVKNPHLSFVTVTDVRVTDDLQQTTVFYTIYNSGEEREEMVKAPRLARGLIRSKVGKALGIRLAPSLSFQLDALPTTAKAPGDTLTQARMRDTQVTKVAKGAIYTSDIDPYRCDEEDEEAEDDDPQAEETDQEPVTDIGDL